MPDSNMGSVARTQPIPRGHLNESGGAERGLEFGASKEVVRSFRRVGAIVAVGVAAFGIWCAYRKYYLPYIERRHLRKQDLGQTEISEVKEESDAASEDQVPPEVILHQCPRGFRCPCMSPFPFKLETFLRVADISYKVDPTFPITFADGEDPDISKPWLTIKGAADEIEISDSHQCIPTLCKIFNIDLESYATGQRQTACSLLESYMQHKIYWGISLWRWVFTEGKSIKHIQPLDKASRKMIPEVADYIFLTSKHHGYKGQTPEQVVEGTNEALHHLSRALGNHEYFLGSRPGQVDCAAFALLSQMMYNMPESPFEKGIQEYRNLVNYVHRMKENYWTDWDDILQPYDEAAALEDEKDEEKTEFEQSTSELNVNGNMAGYSSDEESQHEYSRVETRDSNHSNQSTSSNGFDYGSQVVNQQQKLNEQTRQMNERHLLRQQYYNRLQEIDAKLSAGHNVTDQEWAVYQEYQQRQRDIVDEGFQTHVVSTSEPAYPAAFQYASSPTSAFPIMYSHHPMLHEGYYQPNATYQRFHQPQRSLPHNYIGPTRVQNMIMQPRHLSAVRFQEAQPVDIPRATTVPPQIP